MRKTVTVLGIFLAMVMVMGCATSGDFKDLNKQVLKIALGVEECQQFIQVDFDQALKEQSERITELEWLIAIEAATPTEDTSVKAKVTAEVPIKKVLKPTEVAKPRLKPPAPAPTELKPPKLTETLEYQLAKLTKRVDTHDKKFGTYDRKLSELQRRLAETEDSVKSVYLWTQPFLGGLPRKPKEKEGLPLPPAKVQAGLDRMAIEILAGRLTVEEKVVGHADPRGKENDNLELSERRAQSCIDYLLTKLGPDNDVAWEAGTKWKDYFVAVAGGPTIRYGNFKYNRRVRFQKKK